ncbi:MAG: rhamnogalacturonan lyase [Prevotella sp.]|nr:rhamnogalacturonan lyase [Prevotella sp.]
MKSKANQSIMHRLFMAIAFVMFSSAAMALSGEVGAEKSRSLVAVRNAEGQTFLSWRYFENDANGISYELYRNGVKLSTLQCTNYVDNKPGSTDDSYELRVINQQGKVVATSTARPWNDVCMRIPLERPMADENVFYTPNDCSVGDVDGDGEMEIFLKWAPSNAHDNSHRGYTSPVFIDCLKLDGTRLWRINLGYNIRAGAHYTQFLVYDFDGDGSAELMCKTSAGSIDAKGNYVSKAATDQTILQSNDNQTLYREESGHILRGPEYVTVFSGRDGHAIHTTWYNPDRSFGVNAKNPQAEYTEEWGDRNGNRGERYLAAVAVLDGKNASAVFCRGYYTKAFIWAVDFDGKELKHRWLHASMSNSEVVHYDANWNQTKRTYNSSTSGEQRYTMHGNGNHNLCVADVDGDGKDEILWGSAALDDDGQLLYSVGYGHGDAIHMGTFIPGRKGLQIFDVHENRGPYSWDLHDAATGEILLKGGHVGLDNGRGMCGHLVQGVEEAVFYSIDEQEPRSAVTGEIVKKSRQSINFRIYWDGDLLEELNDGGMRGPYRITKLTDDEEPTVLEIFEARSINGTKQNPNLQCDLIGDWREEVILSDFDNLYLFTTTHPTEYVVPCLLTDHVYRLSIAWQQTAYNQPPHLGYYLPSVAKKK